ncbi:hypothetical protein TRFO_07717 [Tritrichomonas foetus]|uniref:Uncharacterized protein n=1 Tax=Tritrichomonas foetus TaxID=1144522 RepID=A0A1J4JQK8_9EUKA|nr:hypothetical protein TRFO_07717 [Tritrichomonas foetus]|eukprot:OHT01042.1 hypothetical protein TRFO_07717 [Tritrichomonas foetus]
MSDFVFETNALSEKFNAAMAKIRKLEEENMTLNQLNDTYQEELSQKTEALQQSTRDYAALKAQYEELLMRVTELHLENQSMNQSPNASPTSSPQSNNDELIINLGEKIERITRKKNEYKQQCEKNMHKIKHLEKELKLNNTNNVKHNEKNSAIWDSTFHTFVEMVSPYFPTNKDKIENSYSYLLEATHALITLAQSDSVYKQKYRRVQSKYDKVLAKCQVLAQEVANNQMMLENAIAAQNKNKQKSRLDAEISKMHRFLKNYEKQCDNFSQTLPSTYV